MTVFTKQITLNKSQKEVWNIVSDLGAIYKFHPGVKKSYYTTISLDTIGAARICELYPSGKILETVVEWRNNRGFLLQIEPIEKAPPVKNFTGKFELSEFNENHTKVSLTISYEMKLGALGKLLNKIIIQSKMEEGIDALLSGLKMYAEMGIEINDEKHLEEVYLKYKNTNNN